MKSRQPSDKAARERLPSLPAYTPEQLESAAPQPRKQAVYL